MDEILFIIRIVNLIDKLLTFGVKENRFLFNGKPFDLADGVAIRSPLGPSLANIVMPFLEEKNILRGVLLVLF